MRTGPMGQLPMGQLPMGQRLGVCHYGSATTIQFLFISKIFRINRTDFTAHCLQLSTPPTPFIALPLYSAFAFSFPRLVRPFLLRDPILTFGSLETCFLFFASFPCIFFSSTQLPFLFLLLDSLRMRNLPIFPSATLRPFPLLTALPCHPRPFADLGSLAALDVSNFFPFP